MRAGRFPEHPILANEEPYGGPAWDPVLWDGKFPGPGSNPGDIYVTRHREKPTWYVFTVPGYCELTSEEEIQSWIDTGLIPSPTGVPLNLLQQNLPLLNSRGASLPVSKN